MRETINEIIKEGAKLGLEINKNKTKLMALGEGGENKEIKIGEHIFEQLQCFKYLGVMLTKKGDRDPEIKDKITATY